MATIVPITDKNDPRVAAFRDIREHDLVGREGLFIAEGEVVVRALLGGSRHAAVSLFLAEKRVAGLRDLVDRLPGSIPVYVAPQAVMDAIAGFSMHRGILALGRREATIPVEAHFAGLGNRSLAVALFGIANHDNMGGIFRNAAAFGADIVILDSDCCDPLYRKAIRVSAGNILKVPFVRLARDEDALDLLAAEGFVAMALSPDGVARLEETERPDRVALLLGSEGPGLSAIILRRASSVRIAMATGVDSLNVATASGIALHHFSDVD